MRFASTASLVLLLTPIAGAAEAVPEKPAQLKALENFIGSWETEFVITDRSSGAPAQFLGKGAETMEWVLDGRFVQGKGQDAGGSASLMLFGWDADAKEYTAWHFSSNGVASRIRGQWSEPTKTFTWKGDLGNGNTMTGFTRFIDNDNREFQTAAKNSSGKVYFEMKAKLKRVR